MFSTMNQLFFKNVCFGCFPLFWKVGIFQSYSLLLVSPKDYVYSYHKQESIEVVFKTT